MRKKLARGAVIGAAAAVAAGLTVVATSASADVACNRYGECWHTAQRYDYPVNLGIVFHDDAWGVRHHHHYHWRRDRDDRGYYEHGAWRPYR